jgi:hypothetical protein
MEKNRMVVNSKNLAAAALFLGLVSQSLASPFQDLLKTDQEPMPNFSREELLDNSQISYRAEGGFTGVESFSVIISCVKGKISILKSIQDPRLDESHSRIRQLGSMEAENYLQLWEEMNKHALFQMKDTSPVSMDILDEFTHHFYAKVGERYHKFQAQGINRPDASRCFAIRQLIDDAVQMSSLWNEHENLTMIYGQPALTQSTLDSASAQ